MPKDRSVRLLTSRRDTRRIYYNAKPNYMMPEQAYLR